MLSSRARYGVRALFQLACHWGEGPVPLRTVAEEQELSFAYLEQIVGDLRREGLVQSQRGCQGGYELSRDPAQISVGDVIRCLEGPVMVSACAEPDPDFDECGRGAFCVSRLLWMKVNRRIQQAFDEISLADLTEVSAADREDARRTLLETG
ncbi:MAG: RrF2 family transcriptional regulator [Acidobacteriota bacterium]